MYIELLSFIRPVLEYADVIWNNCTQYESNELEKNHNEAARIVTGTTKLVSINSLLSETGWETLSSRRNKHKLTLLYKIQMIFPLNTFVHSYRQPWEVPHLVHCAMQMIFIFYIQTHNYTGTPSYRLRFVTGTNSRLRLVIRIALIYLNENQQQH